MNDKHAYLISVHQKPMQLKKLVQVLDDERNDIYIHIDKKARDIYSKTVIDTITESVGRSKIYFLKHSISVEWGQYSQIQFKLELLKAAVRNGPYSYYHNISGQDFPLKSQDYIHDFFAGNGNHEFLSFERIHECKYRYKYYYDFIQGIGRPRNKIEKMKIYAYGKLQHILFGIDRTRLNPDIQFKKGGAWFSLTEDFVQYILSKEEWIMSTFQSTYCCDEVFLQTLLWNSEYRDRLFCPGEGESESMRLIDWNRGNPYVFRKNDFEELISSKCMWARKFDDEVDSEIIDLLIEHVL